MSVTLNKDRGCLDIPHPPHLLPHITRPLQCAYLSFATQFSFLEELLYTNNTSHLQSGRGCDGPSVGPGQDNPRSQSGYSGPGF